MIADFSQQVDEIFRNQPARQTVIDYYSSFALQAAYDFAPIAVLVTTLIALSLLGRSNELTAAKRSGSASSGSGCRSRPVPPESRSSSPGCRLTCSWPRTSG